MAHTQDDNLRAAQERAWREMSEIDVALEAGAIDEAGWHAAVLAIVEPAYLAGATPQAQSGHSGGSSRWEGARRLLMDAIDRKGTFLDVGCANGLLMESLYAWSRADGTPVEPYGVEISAPLADLARKRLPQWADRIWHPNVLDFDPGRRFTYVRSGLDYVPSRRVEDLVVHLLELTEPGGRVIVGTYNEEGHLETQAELLERLGFSIAIRASDTRRFGSLRSVRLTRCPVSNRQPDSSPISYIMSSTSLRIASDESTRRAPRHHPAGDDESAVDLRECCRSPGALWALTAAGNGEIGAHDALDDTPLTCTNTPGVSSDASLNHWMEPGSREKSMQIDERRTEDGTS